VALRGFLPLDAGANYGRVTTTAPAFEQFIVGGLPSNLVDASLLTQRIGVPALPTGVAGGDRVFVYRAATSISGLTPYFFAASAQVGMDRFESWHRVAGLERTVDQTAVSVLGLPGARLVAGVGYSLDEPARHQTRGYFTLTLRP
jgi:hypothetical protein